MTDSLLRRWLPRFAAVVAVGAFVALGVWQIQRAQEKQALIATLEDDARPVLTRLPEDRSGLQAHAYRRVEFSGQLRGAHQILLDNRIVDGQVGFDVLTPMRLDDGRTILIDRGWVAAGPAREPNRPVALAAPTRVRVTGRIWLPETGIGLGAALAPDGDWPRPATRIEFAAFEQALGHDLVPAVIRADGDAPWLYRSRDLRPHFGPRRHYGYAFQWFALALTVLIVAGALEWRRRNARHGQER